MRRELEGHWGLDIPPEDEEGPQGEFDSLKGEFDYKLKKLKERFATATFVIAVFTLVVIDYALPLSVGLMAAKNPFYLSQVIDTLTIEHKANDAAEHTGCDSPSCA